MPVTRALRVGAMAAVLGISGLFARPGAPLAAEVQCGFASYSSTAAADGVRVVLGSGGLAPVDPDVEGPTASAHADSLGNQSAVAAGVFSEAAVGNLPFLTGLDFSQAPVLATTNYPAQPTAGRDVPGLSLRATSSETGSSASAQVGPATGDQAGATRARTVASAGCSGDSRVAAEASSEAEGISVAGLVRVAAVRSSSAVSVGADGNPGLTSSLVVEGLSVAGQQVAVTDAGLVVGPATVPPVGVAAADAVFESAGVTVRYLAPITDADGHGRLAPGLAITVSRRIEGVGTGAASVTVVLGRAYARAEAAGPGDQPTGTGAVPFGPEGGGGAAVAPADEVPGTTGDLTVEESGALGTAQQTTGGASLGPAASAGPRVGGAAPGGPRPTSAGRATAALVGRSVAAVYPAISLGVAVLGLAVVAFRAVGVRVRWR